MIDRDTGMEDLDLDRDYDLSIVKLFRVAVPRQRANLRRRASHFVI